MRSHICSQSSLYSLEMNLRMRLFDTAGTSSKRNRLHYKKTLEIMSLHIVGEITVGELFTLTKDFVRLPFRSCEYKCKREII